MKSNDDTGDFQEHICCGVKNLEGYLLFSTTPLIVPSDVFDRLCYANKIILDAIACLYEKNIIPLPDEEFVKSINRMPDPDESVVMIRLDYMKNNAGDYVCFDLNTQPGIPGSIVWGSSGLSKEKGYVDIGGSQATYYNAFPVLGRFHQRHSDSLPKLALYEKENSSLDIRRQSLQKTKCDIISGFEFYKYDFVRDDRFLANYDIIEPFFFS